MNLSLQIRATGRFRSGRIFISLRLTAALQFDRGACFGMRLDIPAGTAVRFEPGEEKPVQLVELGGDKRSFGLNGLRMVRQCMGEMSE